MAIPTQFSVTETLRTPIPNPNTELDTPIESVPVSAPLFDGAGLINSLSVPSGDAPTIYSAESIVVLDTPSTATGESAQPLELPTAANDIDAPTLDAPTAANDVSVPTLDAPTAATAESITLDTPSTLNAKVGTATTPPFALNHARILWDNLCFTGTTYSSVSGLSHTLAIIPNTYQRFDNSAGGNGYIACKWSTNQDIDTICIGAHNAGGKSYNFIAYYRETIGGSLIQFAAGKTPTDNTPIMFHRSNSVNVKTIEIYYSGGTLPFYIGYISAGIALQMQRPFFSGHTPITDGDVTRYYHNETESGEIIGQAIRSQGYQTQADWQNIDDTWYRTYFAPFKQAAKTNPFFIAWNLLQYPDDIGFCRINEDISAPYSGSRTLRSISMKLLGHG